jgi:hypothetical protein
MASHHRHSRLRHHRRRPIGSVFIDAFGHTKKSEGDVTRPTSHRKTRRLTPIHARISHHRHSRLRRHRRRKPKLP